MGVEVTECDVKSILTRSSGYLHSVASHSLQPYRGCTFGGSLCGVGCYVQHNPWLSRGKQWGTFLEARRNAAEVYRKQYPTELRYGRMRGRFSIFMSSATDPFVPQEDRFRVTRGVLEAMLELPPDTLILQTHSHRVIHSLELVRELSSRCELRVHISIESDRERLPGLPPPASPLRRRFEAAAALREAGIRVVITVAPLLPIERPREFFERIAGVADGVVIDHFVGGDGSPDGTRTRMTGLPGVMDSVEPGSSQLSYMDDIVAVASRVMPGRVGVQADGFAGRFLPVS